MSSPAEERLQRMRDEGKITPQQYEELRSALAAAEAGEPAATMKPGEAGAKWERILRTYLDSQRPERMPGYLFREWILVLSIAIFGLGLIVGLFFDVPYLRGCSLIGLIIDAYFIRFGKMKTSR